MGIPWWLRCKRPEFDPWVRKIPWRRKWQPTPVLLPGKSHGQRNLVDYSSWDHKEWDTTERFHFQTQINHIAAYSLLISEVKASACNAGDLGSIPALGRSPGEGNGNPLRILAWRIPWTEKPGGLQSTGSQTVGHDWATSLSLSFFRCVVLVSHAF